MFINLSSTLQKFFTVCFFLFCLLTAKSQLATYPMRTGGGNPAGGQPLPAGTNVNVTAGATSVGSEIINQPNGTYNSSGLRVRPNNLAWGNYPNSAFTVNIPLSPKSGFDFLLTSVTFKNNALDNSPNLLCQISYQVNGGATWQNIGTPQAVTAANLGTTITFSGLNEGFYNNALYVFRFNFYGVGTNDKSQGFRMSDLVFNGTMVSPPSIAPIVLTGSLGSPTKYSNTVAASSYSISNGATNVKVVTQSGVCYGTNATPTIANSITIDAVTNGVTTATFNSTLTGLTPNTNYNARAYAITQVDTVYGSLVSFTTLSQTVPILNTNSPTAVLSNKATTGGNNIDSGGYAVLEKGVLYSTVNSNLVLPIIGQTKATSDGVGNSDFVSVLKNLLPSTKYYIKAFARNSLGFGYGNLDSFTTSAPVPSITVNPGTLDFGDITYSSAAPILSYRLNATYLAPAAGTVTLTPSTGYTVCATLNGLYLPTLTLNYTSSSITNKIIYVKSSSTPYGALTGKILHSGGGTVAPNADTTFLTTNVVQSQDTLSNAGSDFWAGFGYQEKMKSSTTQFDTTLGGAGSHLSLFIAAGSQGDSVIVELPGVPNAPTFPRRVFVPASGFVEIGGFPVGDGNPTNPTAGPDTRLYYTGVSKRGIHIYSKSGVPVSAWLYDWNVGDAAAGAMLFPTNTWNSSYVVQAVGGKANSNGYNNNSFFFVIAKDDNTVIKFKPTNDILDSNSATIFSNGHQHTPAYVKYQKDSTYTITLNKGEVFNAMGFVGDPSPGNAADPGALDLSGTVVSTTCDKKIAVFGGNGRCVLGTSGSNPTVGNPTCNSPSSGSDNLIQQMFPKVAWGTIYLTVPTKNMADNLFRVYVQDVNTDVKLNNVLLSKANLIKGLYYQFDVNRPAKIESNIPISVTQFIVSGACQNAASGNIGKGDPEMITLSPVQQSIKSTTVYSATFKNGNQPPSNGCSYINVVVKGFDGVSNFKLDGLTSGIDTGGNTFTGAIYAPSVPANLSNVNAFRKHPFDTSYYYATFRVASKAKHTLSSTQGFNAIAYGVSDGESYGYNAGTTINNLSAIKFSLNPYGTDTATGSVKTGVGNLVTLQIAVPYDTSTINSILWNPGLDAVSYTPIGPKYGDTNFITMKPVCSGTIVRDGRTFYIYKSPVLYKFLEEGAYKVKVTINGTFTNDCGGTDDQYINVIVGHDDILFTAIPAGCGSKNVTVADATTPMSGTSIIKWIWDLGDGTKDSASVGDSWAPNPKINPHTYPNNSAYTIRLTTINSAGIVSYDSVSIDLAFGINTSFTSYRDTACVGESVVFTPTSSVNAAKWFWDFGDSSPIDSLNASPNAVTHSYASSGTYFVSHWVKTSAGCPSAVVKDTVVVSKTPSASFVTPSGVCLPGNTQFTNSSDTNAVGAATPYTYHWSFGTGNAADTSNVKNPVFGYAVAPPNAVTLVATSRFGCVSTVYSQTVSNVYTKPTAVIANTSSKKVCVGSNASFFDASSGTNQTVNSWYWDFGDGGTSTQQNPTHIYTTNGIDSVKLVIGTDKGCVSDTITQAIKVNPKPVAGTILPSSCITSGSLFFQDNSIVAIDADIQTPYTYTWTFGDATGTFTTKDSTHTYAGIGTYYINHSITTFNGCVDTKTDTFTISGSKPVVGYAVLNRLGLCSNVDVSLVDTSRVAIGTIQKIEIRWDAVFNYASVETDLSPSNGSVGSSKTYIHKYPSLPTTRTYNVVLYAYSGSTCMDSVRKTITVYGSPKVIFDTILGICVNGSPKKVNLARDSSGRFNNPVFATWNYSGSSVSNDTFYPAVAGVGTHLIKALFITKVPFVGCRDSAYAPITVWALPTVKFDTALVKCEGNSIAFIDKSIAGSGSGNISSWLWNFGNPSSGTNDTTSKQNPSHTYTNYNTYNVTLKVTSDSGCSNISTPKTITINPKPKVGFISPAGTCAGTPVGFTDTSKIADGTQGLFTHSWNFGDPASGINNSASGTPLPTPSHLYANTPPNPVKLIVTSNNGCLDSASVTLSSTIFPKQHATYIANGKPKDNADVARVCLGNSIKFASGLPANNAFWIFGDSGILVNTTASPVHTYPNAGSFNGQFYVDDINGCRSDTVAVKIEIWSLPTPIIQVNNPTCEKQLISFTDNSTASAGTGNINTWLWKFGEPSSLGLDSSAFQNPFHNYAAYGNYNVTLTITSDSGCKATTATPTIVNVHPKPKVTFVLPSSVCLPLAAQFTDTSKIADGTESQFTHLWSFGDVSSGLNNYATGNPLTAATHNYTISGNYNIVLRIRSKDGCIDSSSQTLSASVIHNQPHADYTVNTTNKDTPTVCLGTPITFKDASIGTTKSYWIWGDEGLTTYLGNTPPPHLFSPAGSYYGIHFVDDVFGCRSDTADFLTIIDSFPVVNGGEKYILQGSSALLTPYISGAASILWTPIIPSGLVNDYLDYNDVETPFCTPLDSVIYRIDVKSVSGCAAPPAYFAVKLFSEPNIPNVFSPNGDGINDTWDITSLQYFTGSTVQVFNRGGQLVFNSLGYSRPWKGTDISGSPLPVGVYYYIIKPGLGLQPRSGSITILR